MCIILRETAAAHPAVSCAAFPLMCRPAPVPPSARSFDTGQQEREHCSALQVKGPLAPPTPSVIATDAVSSSLPLLLQDRSQKRLLQVCTLRDGTRLEDVIMCCLVLTEKMRKEEIRGDFTGCERFAMSSHRQIRVFPSPAELALSLSQLLVHESRGVDCFRIGLSGGSLVQLLSRELPKTAGLNTEGWKVAMCDERLVPFSDPESTYGEYKRQLIPLGLLSESQFIVIDPSLPVEDAATDYEKKLREIFPGNDLPNFDLLILGIGPDGHTASLFPGHPLLEVTDKIVAPISDSPKPPPERVTLTLPVINAAKTIVFVATGEGKATVLKRILQEESDPLPAARVSPVNGKLLWFLDEPAARDLTCPVEKHSVL